MKRFSHNRPSEEDLRQVQATYHQKYLSYLRLGNGAKPYLWSAVGISSLGASFMGASVAVSVGGAMLLANFAAQKLLKNKRQHYFNYVGATVEILQNMQQCQMAKQQIAEEARLKYLLPTISSQGQDPIAEAIARLKIEVIMSIGELSHHKEAQRGQARYLTKDFSAYLLSEDIGAFTQRQKLVAAKIFYQEHLKKHVGAHNFIKLDFDREISANFLKMQAGKAIDLPNLRQQLGKSELEAIGTVTQLSKSKFERLKFAYMSGCFTLEMAQEQKLRPLAVSLKV